MFKSLLIGSLLILSVPAHSQLLSEDQVDMCYSVGLLSAKVAYIRSKDAPKNDVLRLVASDDEKLSNLLISIVDMAYDIKIKSIEEAGAFGAEMKTMCLSAFSDTTVDI